MPPVSEPPVEDDWPCPVCHSPTEPAGQAHGRWTGRTFALRHCLTCRFSFLEDPWTDFKTIYGPEYYEGRGPDPTVDYVLELEAPTKSVRHYEWRGVTQVVSGLLPLTTHSRWLDFGSGNGGLVRYVRDTIGCDIFGFDDGWIGSEAARQGIPMLDKGDLEECQGTFDVVTMIEVIEHAPEPVELLRAARGLLRPGGLLFLTTGNAKPFRNRLPRWSYVMPEVHVSFFEPSTLSFALTRAGFRPESVGYVPGFTDIIRFKILKALGRRYRSAFEQAVPWAFVCRLADWRRGPSEHPVGWAT